jgi:hypothetical protein
MAQLPTAEECGRQVLSAYREKSVRAGEMLVVQVLRQSFRSSPWQMEDLTTGLNWCIEQGYLSVDKQRPTKYFLTETGFAAV